MELKETFETVAELYDRARPAYPAELFDALEQTTGLGAGARVLEIAPATGTATVDLARRGYHVTGVELGNELARVGRRNLAGFPNASIEVARFEDWSLPRERFDLVCCATAFHWLDPEVRLEKCAAALRPGGWLAVWWQNHVEAGPSGQFFIEVQECYERWMPGTEPGLRLALPVDLELDTYGIDVHPAFEPMVTHDFVQLVAYTTETYLDVLGTYSNHIALARENRAGLFGCIRELLDIRHGGRITKGYLNHLILARRR